MKLIKSNKIKKDKPKNKKGGFWLHIFNIIMVFFVVTWLLSFVKTGEKGQIISISELVSSIGTGNVSKVTAVGDTLNVTLKDGTQKIVEKEKENSLSTTLSNYGLDKTAIGSFEYVSKEGTNWLAIIPVIAPIFLILFFFWFLSRQVKGAGMQALSFGQSKAKMVDPNDEKQRVTFKDVAGNKEAKEELVEIVDFLRNPKKFLEIGARIPKGALLVGAPGTGKTLLARAVAGEAGVPFFHLSGSEFVEMFVGVGASRVRDLFEMAKKTAPCIIFIDEIDAVGRVRGVGLGGGNDEREQTLNQILVEMDGFEANTSVIVLAATNRQDVLDPALLRPGRFDRRVTLELPDRGDREAILKVHSKHKPLASDVDLKLIAERTPGFSGADLYSLMNEAAILAARYDRKTITHDDLMSSIEKVLLGPERKSHVMSPEEKRLTAYHEGGHALLASLLPHADPVHKISIIARGRTGGYTLKLPIEEKKLQSKAEFIDDITVSLGGYVAEEMILGCTTTGPSNDLQVSSAMARDMVTRYGMSDLFGPIALETGKGRAMFGENVDAEVSQDTAREIDTEVKRIMRESYENARKHLTEYRHVLDDIAQELITVETLEQADYEKILTKHNIPLKK